MLSIDIELVPERWDEENEVFIPPVIQTLELEHSLASVSKWEEKWHKPFFSTEEKTNEESIYYIKCMTLNENVDPDVYNHITKYDEAEIYNYMNDPATATTIREDKNPKNSRKIITSELIYCWMTQLNIPFECDKWRLNRLIMLIRTCSAENAPSKKMSKKELIERNAAINAANRKRFMSKG